MRAHIRVWFAAHRVWCGATPSGQDVTQGQADASAGASFCPDCRRARAEDERRQAEGHVSQDASPDEAREILRELAAALDKPAPAEDCPFTLTAPKPKRAPKFTPEGWQESLF